MRWMEEGRGARRVMMGLLFIAAGLLFGLDRLGGMPFGHFQDWWPVLVILFGLSRVVAPTERDSIGSGITWMLVGGWMLVVTHDWYGLTWRNSWPLVFVAVGAGMVVKALTPGHRRDDAGDPGASGPGAGGVTS